MIDFWSLSNAELERALSIQEGNLTVGVNDPLLDFKTDFVLDHLLWLWQLSGKDIVAMKLIYYDRLDAINPTSKRVDGHA